MKPLVLLKLLLAAFTAQAADNPPPATPDAPAAIRLPKGRCPTMPVPKVPLTLRDGEHVLTARFLLKADGRIENIRVEGRSPPSWARAVTDAIAGYRCLPAEADQEIESEFRIKSS
ncbi:energy transducer TonB [Roseateles sp. DC23W]|uniref:Energy transducer TonB n=1 Tax=Pelomonas dachongensis TaxID=3299029 RepID=A0ABW7EUG6_9BURK